ncbi:bacteriophage holin [[Eubacterium] cellulosolvens]
MAEKLSVKGLALSIGILWAIAILLTGISATFSTWGDKYVELIGSMYIGYSASIAGSIIGAVWGFIDGLIAGAVIAWLYNRFA